jgi:hypothetical protein
MSRVALAISMTALLVDFGCGPHVAGTATSHSSGATDEVSSTSASAGQTNGASSGATNSCEVCDAGCSNGLVTLCLVLDPPGCGAQSATQFCPYGCTPDGPEACNFYPFDGAISTGCIASSATIDQGVLSGLGAGVPAAVTSFLPSAQSIVVATSASAACGVTSGADAGTESGNGGVLTFLVPAMSGGEFPIGPGDSAVPLTVTESDAGVGMREGGLSVARLSVWKNGVLAVDGQSASSGSITVNVSQPGGGTIGSYDLFFGSDEERGTFVAPECDICTTAK